MSALPGVVVNLTTQGALPGPWWAHVLLFVVAVFGVKAALRRALRR